METGYKLLIFDADNTLFDYDRAEGHALKMSLDAFAASWQSDYLELYRRINSQGWKEYERGRLSRDDLRVSRFKRFLKRVGITVDPLEMSNRYLKELGNTGFLYPGARELLAELFAHHSLALLTNGFSEVQRARLSQSRLEAFFSSIVISEEVGMQKPDPEIFHLVLGNFTGVAANDALMIGDNLVSDIKGGTDAGLQTCWYNPGQLEGEEEINPTYTVSDYEELRQVILSRWL